MATSKQVLLSFIPGRIKRLLEFGKEHRMQTSQGTLKHASISMNMINFLLELRQNNEIAEVLDREGGTLLDLISRALHQYRNR